MTKITAFTKSVANSLSEEMIAELAALGRKHGIAFAWKGGVISSSNLTVKIEVSCVGKDGEVETKMAIDFKRYAAVHGVPVSALGKTFEFRGKTYILRGYNPSAPKFPFMGESLADGKVWRLTAPGVQRAFSSESGAAKAKANAELGNQVQKALSAAHGLFGNFTKGQKVLAKWKDGKMYDAVYIRVGDREGYHRVKFEDGTVYGTKTVEVA